MCNRPVDHEEFSAQRCFYHDVAVPINEKPAIFLRQVSRDFAELFRGGFQVIDNLLSKECLDGNHFLSPQSSQRLERFEIERLEPEAC